MKNFAPIVFIFGALAGLVLMAGCTAPVKTDKAILPGQDVFDPLKFDMAKYAVSAGGGENIGTFLVLSGPGEKNGDRLTSIALNEYGSSRLDVWLTRAGKGITMATIATIDNASVRIVRAPPTFNATTIDRTWNTPGSRYAYYGADTHRTSGGIRELLRLLWGQVHNI